MKEKYEVDKQEQIGPTAISFGTLHLIQPPVDEPQKSSANRKFIAILIGSCLVTAIVVGLAVGFGMYMWQDTESSTTVSSLCTTPPTLPTTTTTPSTPTPTTTTTASTPTPSQTTTTTTPPPSSTTTGERSCYSEFQHPLYGTGVLPDTEGEVWRAKPCATPGKPKCPNGSDSPVILISLDGFRADYMLRKMTPNLQHMADCGVHAPYMRAAFPTKTFPNHYTLVTGLFPESHGIIDNNMYDFEIGQKFSLGSSEKFNAAWWGGEPIWNSAMKEGKKVATVFWPGSDAPIQGTRPDICYWYRNTPYTDKVREVLSFFETDPKDFPQFVTLYFEQPDSIGHSVGPFREEVNEQLAYVDSMVGILMDGLIERNLDECINVVVVADHGMAPIGCEGGYEIFLNDFYDTSDYFMYQGVHSRLTSRYIPGEKSADPPYIVENPEPPESIVSHYQCVDYDSPKDWYAKFYVKQDLPKRYHYANNDRIDDVVIDIEEEYAVYRHSTSSSCNTGNHGYDNSFKSTHAIFLASGPAFKHQPAMQMFENIQLYNLLADLLKLQNPAPNNGTAGRLHNILHSPPDLPSPPPPASVYSECAFPTSVAQRNSRRANSDCNCPNLQNFTSQDVDTVDLRLDLNETTKDVSRQTNLPLGVPWLDQEDTSVCQLVQHDYVTGYAHQIKMPVWTAFRLNKKAGWSVANQKYRTDHEDRSCVRVDVRLTVDEQTKCADYTDSQQGISHGFLYPPGFTDTNDGQLDAYISTNIAPMYDGFRKGVWREAMILLEDYTEKFGELHVMLGPIFDYNADGHADTPEQIQANATFVGGGLVPVPSHYYVVVSRVKPESGEDPNDIEATLTKHHVLSIILRHKPEIGNCMDRRMFDHLTTNAARVNDVVLLTKLRVFSDIVDEVEKVRLLTYLPEVLWDRYGWMDLHADGEDSCPHISKVECPAGYDPDSPPLVLISIDGFRHDYIDYKLTPVLERMGKCGVSTPYMRSIYPTLTFPNHYTQVTGLYPESHGIVDNNMYDMDIGEFFYLGSTTSTKSDWWGGEPMWNTFLKHNKTAMTMFWPGSDVDIQGLRPTVWFPYDTYYPYHLRISNTIDYLTGANGPKADFVTLYFSDVDSKGHEGGPGSLDAREAMERVDQRFRQLMDGIYRNGLLNCVNLVVVSDHGMSDISCDRQSILNDYMSSDFINNMYVYEGGAGRIATKYRRSGNNYIHMDPEDQNDQQEVIDTLTCVDPTFGIWHKRDLPIRNHYARHDRVDDLILRAIDRHFVQRYSPWCPIIGYHQWDPTESTMKAFFSAYGVGFKSGFRSETFENIEIYNLLAYLGGLDSPAPNNGTEGALYHLLRHEPPLPTKSYIGYLASSYPSTQQEYDRRSNLTNTGCQCLPSSGTVEEYDRRLDMDAEQKSQIESTHLPNGRPGLTSEKMTDVTLLHHADFVSGYWPEINMALWSAFTLTKSQVSELEADPIDCLRPDVRIEPGLQPYCSEYGLGDPLDIANHFLFNSEFGSSYESTVTSRLLTNAAPMYNGFKNGVWKALHDHITSWTTDFGSMQVFTGPVFDHNMDGRKDQNMTEFVGESAIPMPSHYYAVLLKCPDTKCHVDGDYDMQAFIIPHRPLITNCMTADEFLEDHVARVRDVELLTDLEFPPFTQVALRRKTFTPMTIWDQHRLG